MKSIIFTLMAGILFLSSTNAQYRYPFSKTVDVTDTYWGVTVPDPYRWIENLKDSSVVKWFREQANFTNVQMSGIPGQDKIIKELKDLDNMHSDQLLPVAKAGGKYFYMKRSPGDQVFKLFYRLGKSGKEILLFDPQKYVAGKTFDFNPNVSDDGSRVVMEISEAGTELGDTRILDVATHKFLEDIIPHGGGVFAAGSNSLIIYGQTKGYDVHDPENTLNSPCKIHIVGTPVSSDKIIASAAKNPELKILPREFPLVTIFKNSSFMVLGRYTTERALTLYYAPKDELLKDKINWKPLTKPEDEIQAYFVEGDDLYLLTTKGNPKFKIIKTSFLNPDFQNAEIIDEGNNDWKISTEYFSQSKDYLIYSKTRNELEAKTYAYHTGAGKTTELNVPLQGNVYSIAPGESGGFSKNDNEIVLMNIGWTIPGNFYSYDLDTHEFSKGIFNSTYNYPGLDELVFEEVEVPSHDGVLVPLSIVYNKNLLKKDGSNVAFMQGYGAYGMSAYIPHFNPSYLPLLNRGVVLAFAHVRGGGEKGNEWYLAGKKTTKPNTWKDFNACAEWLINNKFTSPERFGITGASAGGVLIGRAITERPDLYQVAIPTVGCLNNLRLEFEPNGPANIPEFGTVNDSTEFYGLLEMDAYQHIQKGIKYPAQLITTGFNDPRVSSYIPAKFAAKMQAENRSPNPVFLDVNYAGGHFGGSTRDERYKQTAKEYAFLLWQTGHSEFQSGNSLLK